MAKRKTKRSKVNPRVVVSPEGQVSQASVEEHNEGKVDYGGLPRRDLKKSLGCG